MAAALTWAAGTETQVTAAASIDSDPIETAGTIGFSLAVIVTGAAPSGIAGNLEIVVSNDGITYGVLAGSSQSVLVGAGQAAQFNFSFFSFFAFAKLRWTQAGKPDAGTLGTGAWSTTAAPPANPPTVALQPTQLADQPGLVVTSVERLAQFIKTKPNATAIVAALAARFAGAGADIQGIVTARQFAQLASGNVPQTVNEIGGIVSARRPFGASDGTFLNYIRAQIAANRSSGTPEDLYAIFASILPAGFSMRVDGYWPRAFVLTITGQLGTGADAAGVGPFGNGNSGSHLANAMAYFLQRARLAGVWAVLSYELSPDATTFTLDGARGPAGGLDAGALRGWQE